MTNLKEKALIRDVFRTVKYLWVCSKSSNSKQNFSLLKAKRAIKEMLNVSEHPVPRTQNNQAFPPKC